MSDLKKCSYFNVGYCKFSKKEGSCKWYHPEESCNLNKCFDKNCPKRHPKTCKYGEICIFQRDCSYKHSVVDDNEKIYAISKQVEQLKADIEKLENENDCKVNILVKVHLKELEDLRNENAVLRKTITKNVENFNVTLASKDSEIQNAIEREMLLQENTTDVCAFKCDQCNKMFDKKKRIKGT